MPGEEPLERFRVAGASEGQQLARGVERTVARSRGADPLDESTVVNHGVPLPTLAILSPTLMAVVRFLLTR
jgi:hypothetical protein